MRRTLFIFLVLSNAALADVDISVSSDTENPLYGAWCSSDERFEYYTFGHVSFQISQSSGYVSCLTMTSIALDSRHTWVGDLVCEFQGSVELDNGHVDSVVYRLPGERRLALSLVGPDELVVNVNVNFHNYRPLGVIRYARCDN